MIGRKERWRDAIGFAPKLDPAYAEWVFDYPNLGLYVSGETVEDVTRECDETLSFLWEAYALADESVLSPSGKRLKRLVISLFKEARDD